MKHRNERISFASLFAVNDSTGRRYHRLLACVISASNGKLRAKHGVTRDNTVSGRFTSTREDSTRIHISVEINYNAGVRKRANSWHRELLIARTRLENVVNSRSAEKTALVGVEQSGLGRLIVWVSRSLQRRRRAPSSSRPPRESQTLRRILVALNIVWKRGIRGTDFLVWSRLRVYSTARINAFLVSIHFPRIRLLSTCEILLIAPRCFWRILRLILLWYNTTLRCFIVEEDEKIHTWKSVFLCTIRGWRRKIPRASRYYTQWPVSVRNRWNSENVWQRSETRPRSHYYRIVSDWSRGRQRDTWLVLKRGLVSFNRWQKRSTCARRV